MFERLGMTGVVSGIAILLSIAAWKMLSGSERSIAMLIGVSLLGVGLATLFVSALAQRLRARKTEGLDDIKP